MLSYLYAGSSVPAPITNDVNTSVLGNLVIVALPVGINACDKCKVILISVVIGRISGGRDKRKREKENYPTGCNPIFSASASIY